MARKIKFGKIELQLPRSRMVRIILGGGLVIGGILGFLPILGFWMIPLGLYVLSHDFASVRKFRRRLTIKIMRHWQKWRDEKAS